jgi:site-specific DNA-methyltransferase (cytosine-N4-specific)
MDFKKINTTNKLTISDSTLIEGDSIEVLKQLPSEFVQCVVTSPPYWGMRDYGIDGQIGLEDSLNLYISNLVRVFSEVKRILKNDGVLWLNVGDAYTSGNRSWRAPDSKNPAREMSIRPRTPHGLKRKDLIGLPWRIAFALQESGWYLRTEIVWHKPNAMPESVKDRPSRSHEYLFMLTKEEKYYYDKKQELKANSKNLRSVWSINTQPFLGHHFATFPSKLIEPCLNTSSKNDDYILDPFFGSGTVGVVSERLGRKYIGIELNPNYIGLAKTRLGGLNNMHVDKKAV